MMNSKIANNEEISIKELLMISLLCFMDSKMDFCQRKRTNESYYWRFRRQRFKRYIRTFSQSAWKRPCNRRTYALRRAARY